MACTVCIYSSIILMYGYVYSSIILMYGCVYSSIILMYTCVYSSIILMYGCVYSSIILMCIHLHTSILIHNLYLCTVYSLPVYILMCTYVQCLPRDTVNSMHALLMYCFHVWILCIPTTGEVVVLN